MRRPRPGFQQPRPAATGISALVLAGALCLPAGSALGFELVSATTSREKGEYRVRIEAVFKVPPAKLLAVLTDYDRIHELHPQITESRSLGPVGPATEEVYSRFEACVLLFCRTVRRVEHIRMDGGSLFARDVPGRGSFSSGVTEWHFTPQGSGSRLRYEARFVPAFLVAPIIGPAVLARSAEQMAVETMAEAERRAEQADD
ncbi:MAG TPA: SRPBCC family protein [Gammaproteobacteria bacterium]|nr:SRPBCC family protein [Gammaproteobacteria bacterium]HRP85995.1 SRPBCC family protein [Gammaproteobacteria bacterium]